jgi:hypothetical protein
VRRVSNFLCCLISRDNYERQRNSEHSADRMPARCSTACSKSPSWSSRR